jgi:hypothetical protein
VLTRYDDNLCHQLPRPFENVSQSDPNWIERIHFPLVSVDCETIIDVGFGYYPNRNVMDGFAGIAMGHDVRYVRGSRVLRPNAGEVYVGPLRWDVVEGLREIRCSLAPSDAGVSWDLLYEAGFPPSGEEYHKSWRNGRLAEEQIRFYQMGRLSGWYEVDGQRHEVTHDNWRANRDRSWGVRGSQPGADMQPGPARQGGLYSFAYIQFDGWAVQHFLSEDSEGNTTFEYATRYFPDRVEELTNVTHKSTFYPDGIELESGSFGYTLPGGKPIEMTFEHGGATFPTGAVGGYSGYRDFVQGRWMGEEWLDTGRLDLSKPEDMAAVRGLFDFACKVRCGDEVGYAIVECIPMPPYKPYGL